MTVLEMQTRTQPPVRWTEVCATEHTTVVWPAGPASRRFSSSATSTVAPRRRARALPMPTSQVRSCRVSAPAEESVVDDVPTWMLLVCGVAFGLMLLLAVALLGGPAYS